MPPLSPQTPPRPTGDPSRLAPDGQARSASPAEQTGELSRARAGTGETAAKVRAPRPVGVLNGPRRRWRFLVARILHACNQVLAWTPIGSLLRARLWRSLRIPCVDVPLLREGRRAPALDLEVAFLSDLHAGFYMSSKDLVELARRTNALHPDVICLGGDVVEFQPQSLDLVEPFLHTLDAPLGVYAVLGNHEYYPEGELEAWRSLLARCGVTLLENQGERLRHDGASVWIAGVDDLTEGEPDLDAALEGRAPDEPTLLLSHHPDLFLEALDSGVDLQLSGHTHGGQVRVGDWQPLVHSGFGWNSGLFREGASHLYVGNGAGVTLAPVRIGAPPEIGLVRWGKGAAA